MKFAYAARDREVAFIIRLLTIFGVVEQRQMRLLFDHLSNRSYGQILARLRREGLAYFSPDGQFLATSRYSLDHGKTLWYSGHSSKCETMCWTSAQATLRLFYRSLLRPRIMT